MIDTWSSDIAESYAAAGYVYYHELATVADGSLHPSKVVWLRHHARSFFTLDGGPRPDLGHAAAPGISQISCASAWVVICVLGNRQRVRSVLDR